MHPRATSNRSLAHMGVTTRSPLHHPRPSPALFKMSDPSDWLSSITRIQLLDAVVAEMLLRIEPWSRRLRTLSQLPTPSSAQARKRAGSRREPPAPSPRHIMEEMLATRYGEADVYHRTVILQFSDAEPRPSPHQRSIRAGRRRPARTCPQHPLQVGRSFRPYGLQPKKRPGIEDGSSPRRLMDPRLNGDISMTVTGSKVIPSSIPNSARAGPATDDIFICL